MDLAGWITTTSKNTTDRPERGIFRSKKPPATGANFARNRHWLENSFYSFIRKTGTPATFPASRRYDTVSTNRAA